MLKNLPKILLEISQKFPLLCLDFFLLCSLMLTVIIAVRYVYTHNLYNYVALLTKYTAFS